MSDAKRAAGDKNVLVHGAGTAQLALAAGVLDELDPSHSGAPRPRAASVRQPPSRAHRAVARCGRVVGDRPTAGSAAVVVVAGTFLPQHAAPSTANATVASATDAVLLV